MALLETIPAGPLRRRAALLGTVILGGYAAARAILRIPFDDEHAPPGSGDNILSSRQRTIARAAAEALAGPEARGQLDATWQPAADLERLLAGLNPAARAGASLALYLLDEWRLGVTPFHRLPLADREEILRHWQCSPLAVQRSVWGLLHAATAASFAGRPEAWRLMAYPGPCVPGSDAPGRPPGQSVAFSWDPKVP